MAHVQLVDECATHELPVGRGLGLESLIRHRIAASRKYQRRLDYADRRIDPTPEESADQARSLLRRSSVSVVGRGAAIDRLVTAVIVEQ